MAKLDEAEIARIVARAGGLGPRERFAYIKSACANDGDAFDRVLQAHNITRANSVAEASGSHSEPDSDELVWAADRTGEVLGSWRLRRRLGGGYFCWTAAPPKTAFRISSWNTWMASASISTATGTACR